MKHFITTIASAVVVFMGGSAALALEPPVPTATPAAPAVPTDPLGVERFVDAVLAPLGLRDPEPVVDAPSPGDVVADPIAAVTPTEVDGGGPLKPAQIATGQDPLAGLPAGAFAGYGTGTVHHADAVLTDRKLTDIELGFSGAVYTSTPLSTRRSELDRVVAPDLVAGGGFGKGSGLEIGFNTETDEEDQIELDDNAEAKAPPSRDVVTQEMTELSLPFVNAHALRSQAAARSAASGCVLGADLAYGLGSATDAKLLAQSEADPLLSTSAPDPPRGVSQSVSRVRLVPLPNGRYGLMAETRQTIAPITLFKGKTEKDGIAEFTIEVAGEWVLRVFSDGTTGKVTFGPAEEDPDNPVLRILDRKGKPIDQVTLEQFLGDEGLELGLPGVVQGFIGENPRAVGAAFGSKPTTSGTRTTAAADMVRIVVPEEVEDPQVANLRVGHMEVGVAVPAGGIECPGIGMGKRSEPGVAQPGERFTWTINVSNANDCVLDNVKVVDTITASRGVGYKILSTTPKATVATDSSLTFEKIGKIGRGQAREIRIEVQANDDAAEGRFTNNATATGTCGPEAVAGGTSVKTGLAEGPPEAIPVKGDVALAGPDVTRVLGAVASRPALEVLPRVAPAPSAPLPRTGGGAGALLPALMLLTGSQVIRRVRVLAGRAG